MEQYAQYLRKSRFDRDYADLSVEETLKRHEAILSKLVESRGYYVAKTYYEVVSGESIASRPEIQKLLDEVNAGIYAGVLVVDVERLARGNSADQAYISQVFQFSGTKIITPSKIYDPQNEYDEEYFEFGLFMSRREYKTIVRRLVRGRESSANEGKYVGSVAPYGYERVKLPNEKGWSLVPHPEEAEAIRLIFRMWLQGKGTKIISNALNDRGIPTRHGSLWTYSTIAAIIRNPVYMGKIKRDYCKTTKVMENGRVKSKIKHQKNISDLRLFEGMHPALVSEEDFNLAQEIRLQREPSAKVKKEFALSNAFAGLIFCAHCGKRIARTTLSAAQNHRARFRCIQYRYCENVSADYDVVEQEIINALRTWLEGYRVKIDTVGFDEDIADCKRRIEKITQEHDKLSAQMNTAFTLVEQGVYTLDVFQKRRASLTNSMDDLQQQRLNLEATLQDLENSSVTQSNLIPQTEKLLDSYDDMSCEERNALLKAILHKILYRKTADGQIEIDLYPRLPRI